jgi:hypothetical protein
MVNEQVRRNDDTGGLTSLFVSMIELGDAATRFTFNQMQTAVDIFTNPVRAIDRTRDSMNNFSRALYQSAGSSELGSEGHTNGSHKRENHGSTEQTGEPLTGRKL